MNFRNWSDVPFLITVAHPFAGHFSCLATCNTFFSVFSKAAHRLMIGKLGGFHPLVLAAKGGHFRCKGPLPGHGKLFDHFSSLASNTTANTQKVRLSFHTYIIGSLGSYAKGNSTTLAALGIAGRLQTQVIILATLHSRAATKCGSLGVGAYRRDLWKILPGRFLFIFAVAT